MNDLVIRGGEVIDGTGAPGRAADVVIHHGRIVAIVPEHPGPARYRQRQIRVRVDVDEAGGDRESPRIHDTVTLAPRAKSARA
jgi:N-acyl-D-aspartate/D-glutamate deacylase